jgi:calpain-7
MRMNCLRFRQILASVIHPYDQEKECPKMSPSGRYVLRLFFNGCYRKVEIDDLLPASSSSRVLHVLDRLNPGCLWPALLEKAYLKVRGGYDFPGSNSGTDIAVFTGWIPEQIFLHDEDVMPEDLWTRIYNGFNSGGLLLTIGTGRLPRREQRHLGLAAEHDYAILELKDTSGVRELLIKNPWSNGDVWKGATRQWPNPRHGENFASDASGRQPSSPEPSVEMTPGTFWMDFGSIFQHFENLYLNWHPGIFKCREDLHFTWDMTSTNLSPGLFENHLQFSVTSSDATDVWLLLNRHFRTGDYTTSGKNAHGFISLYLFYAGGYRVLLSDGAKLRGPYVDSPNTLLKFSMPAETIWTAVVASQNLPLSKHNFSLSAFSNAPVRLAHAIAKYSSVRMQHGAWTRSMAGGNSDSSTYLTNPQFSFQLPVRSAVALTLSLDHASQLPQAAIHVKILVVFTDGRRVVKLRTKQIVADSKDYRRASAAIEITLEKGSYTIICSTFEKDQYAKFTLSLHTSSAPAPALKPLPPEGSGRLTLMSEPAMFSPDTTRLLAPIKASRLTRATFIAREAPPSTSSPSKPSASSLFKMSLEQGQGPYKTVLASSASDDDDFTEIKSGVRIDDVDLRPNMRTVDNGWLWLVVERVAGVTPANHGGVFVQVEVLSEERIELGVWGRGDG